MQQVNGQSAGGRLAFPSNLLGTHRLWKKGEGGLAWGSVGLRPLNKYPPTWEVLDPSVQLPVTVGRSEAQRGKANAGCHTASHPRSLDA